MIDEQRGAQQPGDAIARRRPEAERRLPEAPQQIAAAEGPRYPRRRRCRGARCRSRPLPTPRSRVADRIRARVQARTDWDWIGGSCSGLSAPVVAAFTASAFSSSVPRFERSSVIGVPLRAPAGGA